MIKTYWQTRAMATGLSQRTLAALVGVHYATMSQQLRGRGKTVPRYIKAAIIAWEILTDEQRDQWIAAVSAIDGADKAGGHDDRAERLTIERRAPAR